MYYVYFIGYCDKAVSTQISGQQTPKYWFLGPSDLALSDFGDVIAFCSDCTPKSKNRHNLGVR